jgi:predicted HTH transcriptional regulator
MTNRLEIENPGLLPFGLTIEDIQKGISKLRNRVIGRVFHELGLIEQWGSGIQRMTAACHERGLDAPRFEEIGTHFRVSYPPSAVTRRLRTKGTRLSFARWPQVPEADFQHPRSPSESDCLHALLEPVLCR